MIQIYPDSLHELPYVSKAENFVFLGLKNQFYLRNLNRTYQDTGILFESDFLQGIHLLSQLSHKKINGIFLSLEKALDEDFEIIKALHQNGFGRTPIILVRTNAETDISFLQDFNQVDDCIDIQDLKTLNLVQWLDLHNRSNRRPDSNSAPSFKVPFGKRVFDIFFASGALVFLSPLLLAIALAIKFTSKGPIIYKSKRAGTGYQIFDFLKFRSMVADADKKLSQLAKQNNQYNDGTFVKIDNDPRITKIGRFIRNTSLDELPQLINVLKGDMSIVGNRPLPVYEAQTLTKDEWVARFHAPAGLTGLWQVTKRGKNDMSTEERIQLDIEYSKNFSFLMDLKIILKTFPALIQEETV